LNKEVDYHSLIVAYLQGRANREEITAMKAWLEESAENKRIFDELFDIWSVSAQRDANEFNAVDGYRKIRDHIKDQDNIQAFSKVSMKGYRIALRIAAVLVIGLVLGILFILKSKNTAIVNNNLLLTEISAPLGSKTKVVLPDGTKVWLNAGSTIRYNSSFNINNRNITLEGEAYFDVLKNTKIPFLVQTPDVTVKVLGTAFNVKAYPKEGSVETTLERGALIVEQTKPDGDHIQTVLAPRQRATLVKQTGKMYLSETETQVLKKEKVHTLDMAKGMVLVSKEVETQIFTAWKDNRLVFRNETFESLAVKLERWYGVKIILADNEIKYYHFNGTIENETINDVLDIVRLTLPIDYTILHNNITITKKK
jgi:transmembrane sensor